MIVKNKLDLDKVSPISKKLHLYKILKSTSEIFKKVVEIKKCAVSSKWLAIKSLTFIKKFTLIFQKQSISVKKELDLETGKRHLDHQKELKSLILITTPP